ncbi:MAG TPA: toll/interleukin-1 receptor domain-containing protein [Ktedonobacteraceae bacterium]
MPQKQPLEILAIYDDKATKDEKFLDKLLKSLKSSLAQLEKEKLITFWDKRQIIPGTEASRVFNNHLQSARVILLLISSDFMALDFPFSETMQMLVKKHQKQETHILPILLRPVSWKTAPFGKLKPLPGNGEFITRWNDEEEALFNIAEGVEQIVNNLLNPPANQIENVDSPPALSNDANDGRKVPLSNQSSQSSIQLQFLKQKQEELQDSLNTINNQIKGLKHASDHATDPLRKMEFDDYLKQKQTARKEVVAELAQIEQQLS